MTSVRARFAIALATVMMLEPRHAATAVVDIVSLTNAATAQGVAAIINASRVHTPSGVRAFVGFDGPPAALYDYFSCVGVGTSGIIVRQPIHLVSRGQIPLARAVNKARLATVANYARFTLPRMFPEAKTVWYFDSDALPIADLAGPEMARFAESGERLQAVGRPGTIQSEFNSEIVPFFAARYKRVLSLDAPSWNAGVWLADLTRWGSVEEEARQWVFVASTHAAEGRGALWKLNTQPIMYLIFHEATRNQSQFLSGAWNCESSRAVFVGSSLPRGCKVVHWKRSFKPWLSRSVGRALWRRYLPAFGNPR